MTDNKQDNEKAKPEGKEKIKKKRSLELLRRPTL